MNSAAYVITDLAVHCRKLPSGMPSALTLMRRPATDDSREAMEVWANWSSWGSKKAEIL